MGRAQTSVDYDVDSNPVGWPERLRVEGNGLWPGGITRGTHGLCIYN